MRRSGHESAHKCLPDWWAPLLVVRPRAPGTMLAAAGTGDRNVLPAKVSRPDTFEANELNC